MSHKNNDTEACFHLSLNQTVNKKYKKQQVCGSPNPPQETIVPVLCTEAPWTGVLIQFCLVMRKAEGSLSCELTRLGAGTYLYCQ